MTCIHVREQNCQAFYLCMEKGLVEHGLRLLRRVLPEISINQTEQAKYQRETGYESIVFDPARIRGCPVGQNE